VLGTKSDLCACRMKLGTSLRVEGIPKLVILRPDGSVATGEGRDVIMQDPMLEKFDWEDVAAKK
jgi:hypothetical protein